MPPAVTRESADCGRKLPDKSLMDKRQMTAERSGPSPAGPPPTTRTIALEHGEHNDSTLYRLRRGGVLRLVAGPSLLGRRVFLYTNHVPPTEEGGEGEEAPFVRNQYRALEWVCGAGAGAGGEPLGAGALLHEPDCYCELRLARAGAFHYYFVYDTAEGAAGPAGSGWFQVEPRLRGGLPLDALACQTVLAKCLGPLARWRSVLRVARESGYNAVHVTPVQVLGASNSSYSIADQLRLNPAFGPDLSMTDLADLLEKLRDEWNMVFVSDVVLNHTANETAWLREHPEATYNAAHCPHLRPAALLDAALARLSLAVGRGDHAQHGVPAALHDHAHVDALRPLLDDALHALRLHELYACDAPRLVHHFLAAARNKVPTPAGPDEESRQLRLVPDPQRRRLHATVDMELALQLFNVYRAECADEEARLQRCGQELRRELERLNAEAEHDMRAHLRAAADNVLAGVRYERAGRGAPPVDAQHPLAPPYFTWPCAGDTPPAALEALLWGEGALAVCAHNGWVMDADPLQDFAAREADGRVYLRRELVAWGDSVKLRYGDGPADSPWLWAHMRQYVEQTAELWDGLRLDNCHSTPLHVAEYMVDCARAVRPDLYVLAELFTNCDHVDNIFVNRLGITSLVREAASAWDATEAARLVHRAGGRAVGSLGRGVPGPARPCLPHALLMDATHDNPSPVERCSVHHVLAGAALTAAACCATGSTRGLDELVPHHVHVVDETRLYRAWAESAAADHDPEHVDARTGLLAARRALNDLHVELATHGYDEVYVDQLDAEVLAITRHNPRTRQSVIVVARTAFSKGGAGAGGELALAPLRVEGQVVEVALEAELVERGGGGEPHARLLTGLAQYGCAVRRALPPEESRVWGAPRREGGASLLGWRALPPGAVGVLRVAPDAAQAAALGELARLLQPGALQLEAPLRALDLADLNVVLYRCDEEERAAGGGGVYHVPGHGPLVYAGLQGVVSLLDEVQALGGGALGHALCANLRAGDWLPDYTWRRLERAGPRLAPLAAAARAALRPLGALPRYLVPAHFAAVARALHAAAEGAAAARLGAAGAGGGLARALALTSVQLLAAAPGAALPPLSPALPPPRPGALSLSAGLPHFAVGHARCWGRDTFVALRGLMLLTERYQEARAHILAFGACLRHGLVPNLLDGGRQARYNARDAVWWWLHAVRQYVSEAPGGPALLGDPVARLFPRDDAEPAPPGAADQPLHDVVQEALDVHFQGLVFRERNAGRAIDAHMSDKGFNVQIGIDPETGFPFGGNDANCGTWMDKMGSSEKAGTRGTPATPRDGSAVELVGLAYGVVRWLAELHRAGRYPYPGVVRRHPDGALTSWTFAQWAERIRRNFERHFWVPAAPGAQDARPDLVHRRAIYKDSHGASRPWADYQLRCNFPIAMVVAPELFDPRHAWLALDNLERLLLGPLGVKTLDPADWAYRPDYDNANDSDDPSVAHGFNYHQGPEWVWPLTYYLRARLAFAHEAGRHARTVAAVLGALRPLLSELRASPWRGLPELCNAGGAPCAHSCRSQAWSSAGALEVLHELRAARRARPLPHD